MELLRLVPALVLDDVHGALSHDVECVVQLVLLEDDLRVRLGLGLGLGLG